MSRAWAAGSVALLALATVLAFGCDTAGRSYPTTTPAKDAANAAADGEVKEAGAMVLTSSGFEEGAAMPASCASMGGNQSPHLAWKGAPGGTKSFAIACIDRHPVADGWVHWLVVDLPAGTSSLAAGASGSGMPGGSRELANTFGSKGWGGPSPPPGTGAHTYEFTVYALDVASLEVADDADTEALQRAMEGHVLGSAMLNGTFGQ